IRASENLRRGAAWIEELRSIAELTSDSVGVTDTELARGLGISVSVIREYLKLARLPAGVLTAILDGVVSRDTAKRLTRLSQNRLAQVEQALADNGEETDEMVRQILEEQITAGLTAVTIPTEPEPTTAAPEDQPAAPTPYKRFRTYTPVVKELTAILAKHP